LLDAEWFSKEATVGRLVAVGQFQLTGHQNDRNCPGWIAILFGAAGLMRWGL